MTLNELIKKALELKEQGYGDKSVVFDDVYATNNMVYNKKDDEVKMY